MAIAFDNAATYIYANPSGNSTSYTMGSGSNGVIFLNTGFNVTAATYNGVSMTEVITFNPSISDGNQQQIRVFRLFNPSTGSNTLSITTNGNSGTLNIVSYTGVDTTLNPDANVNAHSNNGTNNTQVSSFSTSVTTLQDNSWSVMFSKGGNNSNSFTAGSGTLRTNGQFIFGDGEHSVIDSNSVISPAGNSTLQVNWASGSGFISNVIMSLRPVQILQSTGTFLPYFI